MKKKDIRIGNIFVHLGEIFKVTDMLNNIIYSVDLIEVCAFSENSKSTYYRYFDIEHEAKALSFWVVKMSGNKIWDDK